MKRPSGFIAKCQCGALTGAMDLERTDRKEAGRILGQWLFAGCTVEPRFGGTWIARLSPCACRSEGKPGSDSK